VPVAQVHMLRSADMCYVGQSFDVNVPLPGTLDDVRLADAIERFHQRHTSIYGHADPAAAVRLMTVRAQIVGATPKPELGHIASDGVAMNVQRDSDVREIFENGRAWQATVLSRAALRSGDSFRGPAIVEQYDTTTYVPDGFEVRVDRWLNLVGEEIR